jgi:hypothetical protein
MPAPGFGVFQIFEGATGPSLYATKETPDIVGKGIGLDEGSFPGG